MNSSDSLREILTPTWFVLLWLVANFYHAYRRGKLSLRRMLFIFRSLCTCALMSALTWIYDLLFHDLMHGADLDLSELPGLILFGGGFCGLLGVITGFPLAILVSGLGKWRDEYRLASVAKARHRQWTLKSMFWCMALIAVALALLRWQPAFVVVPGIFALSLGLFAGFVVLVVRLIAFSRWLCSDEPYHH